MLELPERRAVSDLQELPRLDLGRRKLRTVSEGAKISGCHGSDTAAQGKAQRRKLECDRTRFTTVGTSET